MITIRLGNVLLESHCRTRKKKAEVSHQIVGHNENDIRLGGLGPSGRQNRRGQRGDDDDDDDEDHCCSYRELLTATTSVMVRGSDDCVFGPSRRLRLDALVGESNASGVAERFSDRQKCCEKNKNGFSLFVPIWKSGEKKIYTVTVTKTCR